MMDHGIKIFISWNSLLFVINGVLMYNIGWYLGKCAGRKAQ